MATGADGVVADNRGGVVACHRATTVVRWMLHVAEFYPRTGGAGSKGLITAKQRARFRATMFEGGSWGRNEGKTEMGYPTFEG